MMSNTMDIGNRCVDCGRDTSFGSGLFVNRIPADAEYESFYAGEQVFKEGQYREGYLCPDCSGLDCDRCDKMIALDEDITPDVLGFEQDSFSDGAYRVHYECLTADEKEIYDKGRFGQLHPNDVEMYINRLKKTKENEDDM